MLPDGSDSFRNITQLIRQLPCIACAAALCLSVAGRCCAQVSPAPSNNSLATSRNISVTRSFTEPLQQSLVAASQTGIVTKILVREGQSVSRGDVIAELDHDELDQSLRIAQLRASTEAKVNSAKASLQIRKARRDAIQPMLDQGHANPAEVEEAMVDYNVAVADLAIAQQELAEAQLSVKRILAQINARKVLAPFDGVVTELHYQLGESVSASTPHVATVVQLDKLLTRFYLSEQDVLSLTVGQRVAVEVRSGSKRIRPQATIRFVSPVTDPDSGTARVDVLIDNPSGKLRSGSPCHWLGTAFIPAESNLTATFDSMEPNR